MKKVQRMFGPKKSFQDSNLPRGPGLPSCSERRTRPVLSQLQKNKLFSDREKGRNFIPAAKNKLFTNREKGKN